MVKMYRGIFYKGIFFIFFTAIVLINGCQTEKASCQTEANAGLRITFGKYYQKDALLQGYRLNSDATLHKYERMLTGNDEQIKRIGRIDANSYCEIVRTIERLFVDVQVLNSPGDTSRFVEYVNPGTSVTMRAIWNPAFETKANREFQIYYDSLQKIVEPYK